MPSIKATIDVPIEASQVYSYLRDRYDSEPYRSACFATKGYVPPVARIEDVKNTKLRFSVPGRDSLLRIPTSSWVWTYELESTEPGQTRVIIEYRWGCALSVLSLWTVRHQAANELVETVLAITALDYGAT